MIRDAAATPWNAWDGPSRWGISANPGGNPGKEDAVPGTIYAAWQRQHFSAPEQNDPATAGPLADPDANGLPAFRWNGFHGIELISRSSSTPDLESQLRSMDNYPDTGGPPATRNSTWPHDSLNRSRSETYGWQGVHSRPPLHLD